MSDQRWDDDRLVPGGELWNIDGKVKTVRVHANGEPGEPVTFPYHYFHRQPDSKHVECAMCEADVPKLQKRQIRVLEVTNPVTGNTYFRQLGPEDPLHPDEKVLSVSVSTGTPSPVRGLLSDQQVAAYEKAGEALGEALLDGDLPEIPGMKERLKDERVDYIKKASERVLELSAKRRARLAEEAHETAPAPQGEPKCECGATATRSLMHSHWCPLSE
jgi:hypothetical protein